MNITTILIVASMMSNVPPSLLTAVCDVESGLDPYKTNFNDGQGRHSHGLCQVQTRTAKHMGYKGPRKGLYNPLINSYYAGMYLRYQKDRYGTWEEAVAAYNAGRVMRRTDGTYVNQTYVDKVFKNYRGRVKK